MTPGLGGATAPSSASQRIIKVAGEALKDDVDGQLEAAVVVDRFAMPDMFQLVFRDPGKDVLERAKLKIGAEVVISTSSQRSDTPATLIDGEVTSIEADYDSLGTRAVVRGYDRSHRLAAGRKTATFQNVTYSDIAKQIAGDVGLEAEVDDSGATLDHVLQANQSDLDFLYSVARRIGFDFRVDGRKLLFKDPSKGGGGMGGLGGSKEVELTWNDELLEFRARMSAVAQVKEVKVRGWDVASKEAVIGQADAKASNATISMQPADLAKKVGGKALVVVDHPVETQEAADELAKARAEQVASAAFEATAVTLGSPDLKAGATVTIKGVDKALEGSWVVSGSRHEFGAGRYRTFLEFNGRQDRSITGSITGGGGGASSHDVRIPGVVVGIVTDNEDPKEMGRVRVSFPWLADDAESWWARIVMPGAGNGYGVVWVPQVGDEVLVAFQHGDVRLPLVLGGLWNGQDAIPFQYDNLDAGDVTYCGFVSRSGHQINFWESGDDSSIQLLTTGGKFDVVLDETNKELRITADGKVKIEATGDIEIATDGAFKVNAKKELSIESSGQVKVKGATVALN